MGGVNRSKAEGFAEGFGLGLGKGLQVGTTLGYYRKFAEVHLRLLEELAQSEADSSTTTTATNSNPPASVNDDTIEKFPPGRREKLAQSLKVLLRLIDNFSFRDCETESLFLELGKIESKFKQIKALISLKVAPQIRHSPKSPPPKTTPTTGNDLSF